MVDESKGTSPEVLREKLKALEAVKIEVRIELGRSESTLADVLALDKGSVVVLDRKTNEPVEIFIKDKCIARGWLRSLDGKLCIEVGEIVS